MEYRNLGHAGVKVSPLCLGCWNFGARIEADEAIPIIHAALDAGINFLDTANVYSRGRSEEIVGQAIAQRRDQVVLASKVHSVMGEGPNERGSSRYHIMAQVEASLRRLGTDRIDLYQLHGADPAVPIEETLRALDDLRQQGKVVYFGTSNFAAWQLGAALWSSDRLKLAPIVSTQPPYSLFERRIETEVLPLCRAYGLAVLPYSPLAGGWLSEKYRRNEPAPADSRFASSGRDVTAAEHAATFDALEALQELATAKEVPLTQLALAWVLAQPGITAPIIGPRTLDQFRDNLGALDVTVTAEDQQAIDRIVAPGSRVLA